MSQIKDVLSKDIESITGRKELFEPLKGTAVFITGATGLIGSMMIRVLHAANIRYDSGIRIIGQIRNKEKAEKLFGSLLSEKDIELTEDLSADCNYIIHTLSPTASKFFIEHPVETIKASVNSTMEVLETAYKNKASVVYLSSMEQYGVPYTDYEVMTEDKTGVINHLNIRSCYSESKRLCECLCASYAAEYNLNVKIARLSQTFGAGVPMTDNRMPMQFAKSAVSGNDIVLHTEGRSLSNVVYLSDAITGILTVLIKGKAGEAYNICNDTETRSVREIAVLIADKVCCGRIKVRVEIPNNTNMGYAPETHMYLSSEKLRNLGWEACVSMEEGYRRLTEYIKENQN